MGNIIVDYSNVAPEDQHYSKYASKFPIYFVSVHTDGRVGMLGADGKPVEVETAKEIIRALYSKYFDKWYVYIGKRRTMPKYKIGISRNPEKRAEHLGIELIRTIPCIDRQDALEAEMALHTLLVSHDRQIKGEWFTLDKEEARRMIERLEDTNDVHFVCSEKVDALLGEGAFKEVNFPAARRKYMKLLHRKE